MPRDSELHAMLLRLAGRIPDDLLTRCREWAADGREADVAAAVAFAVLWREAKMHEDDIELLADLTEAAGGDPGDLPVIEQDDDEPPMFFQFLPVREPGQANLEQLVALQAGSVEDAVDQAAVDAVAGDAGARGLWRAWRHPAVPSPWPGLRRVYVVEVDDDVAFVPLTAHLQQRLAAAGEADPQVEVVPAGVELPAYQSSARAFGALLWASTPEREFRLAEPFDEVTDAGGPVFHPDHPRIDDPVERRRILHYLRSGEAVLVSEGLMDDVVEPTRREVVPLDLRTDGFWVWLDTTAYYLEEHHLAPPEELLAHVRAADYAMPEVDGVTVHRATAQLIAMGPTAEDAESAESAEWPEFEPALESLAIRAPDDPEPEPAAIKGMTSLEGIATVRVTAGGPAAPVL